MGPRNLRCAAGLAALALLGWAGAPVTFTVSFADSTPHGQVTVFFSSTGGTAAAGTSCGSASVDYVGVTSQALSFIATKAINITVCGDTRDEADETFSINSSTPAAL